jgi:GNAT superfamily N-acetyltransferase
MDIRQGTEEDIPNIVRLLKISLGESLMPKSESFWRWKHVNNPFGRSLVLVAEEKGELIGVRAFMRWEWKQGDKVLKTVRAVDTATHPRHQGKGIFKKLTMQLLEQSKNEEISFVFNTPNKKSKPGYLKMGWFEIGRLPIQIQPRIPLSLRQPDFGTQNELNDHTISWESLGKENFPSSDGIVTNRVNNFLSWRYRGNPNIPYHTLGNTEDDYFIVFRLKQTRLGVEFRICEKILGANAYMPGLNIKLRQAINSSGATLVTFSGDASPLRMARLPIGPMVTVRPLSCDTNSLSFRGWKPTLGDMEVF